MKNIIYIIFSYFTVFFCRFTLLFFAAYIVASSSCSSCAACLLLDFESCYSASSIGVENFHFIVLGFVVMVDYFIMPIIVFSHAFSSIKVYAISINLSSCLTF